MHDISIPGTCFSIGTDDHKPDDFKDFDNGIRIKLKELSWEKLKAKDANMAGGMVVESDDAIVVGFPNFDRLQASTRGEGNILRITDKKWGDLTGAVSSPANKKFHKLRKELAYPDRRSRTPYLGLSVASGIYISCFSNILEYALKCAVWYIYFQKHLSARLFLEQQVALFHSCPGLCCRCTQRRQEGWKCSWLCLLLSKLLYRVLWWSR